MYSIRSSPALKNIGVPKESKSHEYRVSITPDGVRSLVNKGCNVFVESGAGLGAGFKDFLYSNAGAKLVQKEDVFAKSDLIVKVKEPHVTEYDLIKPGQAIFTFFHFAGNPGLEDIMRGKEALCIAYETIQKYDGTLPILAPMSEIAGRLAVQEGMRFLTKSHGGQGLLLSGVPGVEPATVVVIGAGTVGYNAAKVAAGLGAKVYLLDTNISRLRYLDQVMPPNVFTLNSTFDSLYDSILTADLVVGGVLVPGKEAPKIVGVDMLKNMKPGSVFVDVAIDQGGMTPLSVPTSHEKPVYSVGDMLMYCVPNLPGIVPQTSTMALTNVTLPYIEAIALYGFEHACAKKPELLLGRAF